MRILQIHNKYIYYGGEDSVVDEEAILLKKNNNQVFQLFRDNKKEIITFSHKIKALINLPYSKNSINIINETLLEIAKPDVVHIHNIFPLWTYSILEALNKKNIPIVMTLHNYRLVWDKLNLFDKKIFLYGSYKNSAFKTFFISRLMNRKKKLLKYIDKFIALTEFTKQEYIEAGIPQEKLVIKPNFLSKKKVEIKKIETKDGAIFASRVSKEKGILTLIKAWKDIQLKIKIFGDGPLLDGLKAENSKIKFLGNLSRDLISEEIKKAKFLIFPSEWYECMPMTILEAFREGTLVLASNIGSIKSIIKDKHNGVLFNPGDHNDIRKKVEWVLNNPEKCNKIVENALNDFNEKYTSETNYQKLTEIYKDIIHKKTLT